MPGIGHLMMGLAAGRAAAPEPERLGRALVLFSVTSMLPDLDAIGFVLGVPYGATFGHRGATHSVGVALVLSLGVALVGRWLKLPALRVGVLAFLTLVVHGLTDALTNGGLGVALLWPFTEARIFLPWRPILVAPIGPDALTTAYGQRVLAQEVLVFLPFLAYACWPRRRRTVPAPTAEASPQ